MHTKIINAIFTKLKQQRPNPTTELIYQTPFELLVAVILSQQATDVSVNKVTKELFKIANTPEAIIELGVEKLKTYIKSIGLYNTKAHNIIKTAKILLTRFNNIIPDQETLLLELPGVGHKTAKVILNTLFMQDTIAVDTHVLRVANRLGFCNTKSPTIASMVLNKLIPKKFKRHAHHWLILHGRYTCKARKPLCHSCIINKLCEYNEKAI